MGTSLHAHIEVKKGGRWLHYACPRVQRNYILFACMNGTRKNEFAQNRYLYDQIVPVAHIHELPDDISEVTAACLEADKGMYLIKGIGVLESQDIRNLQELLWKLADKRDRMDWDLEESLFQTYICGESIAQHEGFEDSRIVFWFDN